MQLFTNEGMSQYIALVNYGDDDAIKGTRGESAGSLIDCKFEKGDKYGKAREFQPFSQSCIISHFLGVACCLITPF